MKIKEFIKKYWLYIVIGILLLLFVGIFVLILTRKKVPESSPLSLNKEITSPFMNYSELPTFALPQRRDFFEEEFLNVYSILPSEQLLSELVFKFDNKAQPQYPSEVMDFWSSSSNTFTYYKGMGIFKISSQYGLGSHLLIKEKEEIKGFLNQYFEYTDINTENIVVNINPEGGYTYKGKYMINGYTWGSIYLQSYAYIIETNKESEILNMSIFLYNKDSMSVYSQYSVATEQELLSNKRVYIDRVSISENYNELDRYIKGTTSLTSLDVKEMRKTYVFTDFVQGYVYPIYLLTADARYKDYHDKQYAADILVYLMATEQGNISPREEIVEFHEMGASNE